MAKVKKLKAESNVDKIRKKYSAGKASTISLPKEELLYIPSRVLPVNDQLGGGLAYGRILEIIGWESSGKTLLATDFGVVTQKLGGVVIHIDAEGSFTSYWAEENGLDLERTELMVDSAVEVISDYIRDMIIYWRTKLVKNEPILVILDSIAALECEANIDSDQAEGKAEMGNRAKAIYKLYRKRNRLFGKYGVGVIVINQVRDKVGAGLFESAETTPGGQATKFYASYRLMITKSKQIKYGKGVKEKKVGNMAYVQVAKNKLAPPKKSVKTEVHFVPDKQGYTGFSRYAGLAEILERDEVITRKGSNYYFKGEKLCNGEEAFSRLIAKDDKLRARLVKRSSVMTISKMRERLDNIKENRYPVNLKSKDEDEA